MHGWCRRETVISAWRIIIANNDTAAAATTVAIIYYRRIVYERRRNNNRRFNFVACSGDDAAAHVRNYPGRPVDVRGWVVHRKTNRVDR